jgi:biotin synthase
VVASGLPRNDWTREEVRALFALPFPELIFRAAQVHRDNFDPSEVQISTLLSIKTGGCPEDCAYCPQSAKFETGVKAEKLMDLEAVLAEARAAKAGGASRFCMGAAWRSPKDRDLEKVCDMVEGVKALGMETCVTLGMLTGEQAQRLKTRGLDYYNHNLDTSPEFYGEIISTRTYQDRLDTLEHVRAAGINVCCGGIVGMGEKLDDRIGMIATLASLPVHPESVPINMLVPCGRYAARADSSDRTTRFRAYDCGRAHNNARFDGSVVGGPGRHERRNAGALFPRRRQFDLLRPQAADDAKSRTRPRHGAS